MPRRSSQNSNFLENIYKCVYPILMCSMERKSISIREEQSEFLEEHDVNLSGVVRRRIDEIMESGVIELNE